MSLILHGIKSSELNFSEGNFGEYVPPAQIVLLPKSPIVGRDGRTFTYNTQEVLDSFIENQADLPIDIEHATEIKAPRGEYSPAVGFVKSIQAGNDGEIIGNIEWNNNCYELKSKSYKYYSPAFEVGENNKVLRSTSVGLTNSPNFKVVALNSRESNSIKSKKGEKKLKKLTRVLNARKSRNDEEIKEEEADFIAANFLMPEEILKQRYKEKKDLELEKLVPELAKMFEVSGIAMVRRLKDLGIINHWVWVNV